MKRIAATAALALAVATTGLGATASAGTPVTVGLFGCVFGNGGTAIVPAGSAVSVRIGLQTSNRGRAQDFINAQTTSADVGGTPIVNASGLWTPAPIGGGDWAALWVAPVGTLASAGDSLTVHFELNLAHKIPQGKDPDTGKQFFLDPGEAFPGGLTCTIMAS